MSIIKFGYINKYVNVDKRKITTSKKKLDAPAGANDSLRKEEYRHYGFLCQLFFITGKYII